MSTSPSLSPQHSNITLGQSISPSPPITTTQTSQSLLPISTPAPQHSSSIPTPLPIQPAAPIPAPESSGIEPTLAPIVKLNYGA